MITVFLKLLQSYAFFIDYSYIYLQWLGLRCFFFQIKYDFMVVCMGMQLNFNQVSCLLSKVGTNTYRPKVSLVSKEKNNPPLMIYNVFIPLF